MPTPQRSPTAPSLRTTRSRANPTVTLYSLDAPNLPPKEESLTEPVPDEEAGPSLKPVQASVNTSTESKFFPTATASKRLAGGKDISLSTETVRNQALPWKRRKLDTVPTDANVVDRKPISPSSSLSSLSSPPPTLGSASPSTISVKAEPPATPLRRNAHTSSRYALDTPERHLTPLKSVKDEKATLDQKTPKIKKESSAKPRTSTPIKLKLDKPHPEPPRWRRQYELIEKMREKIVAPVDTLGCETPNRERTNDAKTIRFHMLISLMLSSQTKDPVTSQAVSNLHDALPGGLTAASLAAAPPEVVAECINKVGFWRRKTEYIQEAARRIVEGGLDDGEARNADVEGISEEAGDIPRTLNGLVKLKGVGPKMAFLALQCAWNINAGVGVDVHVHRITNRLGWHKPKTTEPEQTRLNLESWLPPHLFKPINHVLVGFGQVVCLPVGPRCDVCFLGTEKICPSRVANVNVKGRKVVEFGFIETGQVDASSIVKAEGKESLQAVGLDGAQGKASPILKRIEIEIGTDPFPGATGVPVVVKQEPGVEEDDQIQKIVEEPAISQPEQVVDIVMQEMAREEGQNVRVVKAE